MHRVLRGLCAPGLFTPVPPAAGPAVFLLSAEAVLREFSRLAPVDAFFSRQALTAR